jgi:hypothetical protein
MIVHVQVVVFFLSDLVTAAKIQWLIITKSPCPKGFPTIAAAPRYKPISDAPSLRQRGRTKAKALGDNSGQKTGFVIGYQGTHPLIDNHFRYYLTTFLWGYPMDTNHQSNLLGCQELFPGLR